MKKNASSLLAKASCIALAAFAAFNPAHAQLTVVAAGYSADTYYTHPTSDHIISYDWDSSGNLYYMTSAGFPDVSVWQYSGGTPSAIYANSNNFAGASVLKIGDYIYFNDSDLSNNQLIHDFGPLSGTPSVNSISTSPNYALYAYNGNLFISGADASFNSHIYYSPLAANGTLTTNPAVSIANVGSGASGPIAFDTVGDLYYAPGFGDLSIYKWSASDLASAIANPTLNALSTSGHLWLDYSSLYPTVSGATSMLLDPSGNLLVTLTDFSDPSSLVAFGTAPNGSYDGADTTIATDTGALGELREHNGGTYLSADNEIVQIVPEPCSWLLASACLPLLLIRRNRKNPQWTAALSPLFGRKEG